jgi:hypothetical protein
MEMKFAGLLRRDITRSQSSSIFSRPRHTAKVGHNHNVGCRLYGIEISPYGDWTKRGNENSSGRTDRSTRHKKALPFGTSELGAFRILSSVPKEIAAALQVYEVRSSTCRP